MAATLTITATEEGRITILHLSGRLDAESQGQLMDAARKLHDNGVRFLLIDLQNVDFIASAGLGALHNIYKLFTPEEEVDAWRNEKHGEPFKSPYMKLAMASPSVYYVLNIAGFLQNIPIYPDLQSALASFPK
ncbi:MAG TPA: STAS domain-containing protein [Anaerolineales bacterium]|nr:STAS domain-containing protein [Anaerolineales bacterium]